MIVETKQGRIVIEISGGVVQAVYGSYARNLRVVLVDHDSAEVTEGFPVQPIAEYNEEDVVTYDRRKGR